MGVILRGVGRLRIVNMHRIVLELKTRLKRQVRIRRKRIDRLFGDIRTGLGVIPAFKSDVVIEHAQGTGVERDLGSGIDIRHPYDAGQLDAVHQLAPTPVDRLDIGDLKRRRLWFLKLQVVFGLGFEMRIAVVVGQLHGSAVHSGRIEGIAVGGARLEVLSELALYKRLVIPDRYRMGIYELDVHALERDGLPRLVGHVVRVVRDLDLLEHLAHGDGQAAVAALPDLLGTSVAILGDHLSGDHDGHVALGERVGIDKHHVVASEKHGLESGAFERTTRKLLDLRVIG